MRASIRKLGLYFSFLLIVGCGQEKLSFATRNPDGIIFGCKTAEPPEILREAAAELSEPTIFVHFTVENAPKDKTYEFYIKEEAKEEPTFISVYKEQDGALVDVEKGHRLEDQVVFINGYLRGSPFYGYLVSKDRLTCVSSRFIPNPFEAIAKDGAKVSLIMHDFRGHIVGIEGTGFLPNEELVYILSSYNEVASINCDANKDGTFTALVLPAVEGAKGGYSKIKIKRKNETIRMEFPWGMEVAKQIIKNREAKANRSI